MANRTVSLTDREREILKRLPIPVTLMRKLETVDKKRSARYGKSKGASFQLWVAEKISDLLSIDWNNKDDDSPIQTRSMGLSGVDIILRGDAKRLFPFDVECKAVESLNVYDTVEQAEANQGDGRDWLVAWKNKRFKEPVVIMAWSAFEKLFHK